MLADPAAIDLSLLHFNVFETIDIHLMLHIIMDIITN